jgi:hypothetical protein
MRVLGHHVLSRPPRAAGKWVVVTIEPGELHGRGLANGAGLGSVLFRGSK